MSRTARLIAAALLVLAVGALTACGGGSSSSSGSGDGTPTALVKDTFGAGHPIRSGRVDALLDVDLKGFGGLANPVKVHISGPFQANGGDKVPDFALSLDLPGARQQDTLGAIFTQGGAYLTVDGRPFDLGRKVYDQFEQAYRAAKQDKGGGGPSLHALGIAPLRWLKDPKDAGGEDIAGTATRHVTAQVDVPKLLTDLSTLLGKAKDLTAAGSAATGAQVPTQLTADQRAAIARSVRSATLDVWTGTDDHTLRKLSLDVEVAVPEDLQQQAGGLKTGHVILQVTLAQLNQAQKIAKPKGAQPWSALQKAMEDSGLVGSGSSGSASSSTPSADGGAAGPAAASPDPYDRCITAAGDDLSKVQRCAGLVN